MKMLNGKELSGFIKARQAVTVRALTTPPTLLILRDSDNPVITKYVNLKIRYGEDIGVKVIDKKNDNPESLSKAIIDANSNPEISGIIVQLPLKNQDLTDEIVSKIAKEKDVDGLAASAKKTPAYKPTSAKKAPANKLISTKKTPANKSFSDQKPSTDEPTSNTPTFISATATAILWLLAGYDINLDGKKIAIVGRGRLVGAPLYKALVKSANMSSPLAKPQPANKSRPLSEPQPTDTTQLPQKYAVEAFGHDSDLTKLKQYDIIITATGVPHLILSSMVKSGAIIIDAGTASEDNALVGDVDYEVYNRKDLKAITPRTGGVGPLTVSVLFDNVITASQNQSARISQNQSARISQNQSARTSRD